MALLQLEFLCVIVGSTSPFVTFTGIRTSFLELNLITFFALFLLFLGTLHCRVNCPAVCYLVLWYAIPPDFQGFSRILLNFRKLFHFSQYTP